MALRKVTRLELDNGSVISVLSQSVAKTDRHEECLSKAGTLLLRSN